MSKFLKVACCLIAALPFMQSCVDNDYDIDDLNKDAVFKIPPVPFGDIIKFDIETLALNTELIPDDFFDNADYQGRPVNLETGTYSETVNDIFTEDIIKKFFYEDAEEDVLLKAKIDIHLLRDSISTETGEHVVKEKNLDFLARIIINVIDKDGDVLPVIIPYSGILYSMDNQDAEIRFPNSYFGDMKNASGLKFTFGIKTYVGDIGRVLDGENYIQLKNVVLSSAGMKFKF
ncbi:MAG: hypothetical protein LBR34_00800 [Prevotella sp.]|jgi:hypothetical protein|nr:hypothetical protein [Prevotella sp.]